MISKIKNNEEKGSLLRECVFGLYFFYLFFLISSQSAKPTAVSPAGSVGASALKCRGVHRTPAPFTQRRQKSFMFL